MSVHGVRGVEPSKLERGSGLNKAMRNFNRGLLFIETVHWQRTGLFIVATLAYRGWVNITKKHRWDGYAYQINSDIDNKNLPNL